MARLYWEDIGPEAEFRTPEITIDKADIVAFAQEFDPQPFHLDEAAGAASIFGGFCASGWHVCALTMRLLADTFERQGIAALDSPGVPSLRWLSPVYGGDSLSARIAVRERSAAAEAGFGLIRCHLEVYNQHGRLVLRSENDLLIARRPEGAG